MKIVLSKKGFDAANGGVASPILPDGVFVPLRLSPPFAILTRMAKLPSTARP